MRRGSIFLMVCYLFSVGQCSFDLSIACRSFSKYVKSGIIASTIFSLPVVLVTPTISFAVDEVAVPAIVNIEQPKVVLNEYIRSSSTGIEYYDYTIGDGPAAKFGDKVLYNYKGRLAGSQDSTNLSIETANLHSTL